MSETMPAFAALLGVFPGVMIFEAELLSTPSHQSCVGLHKLTPDNFVSPIKGIGTQLTTGTADLD